MNIRTSSIVFALSCVTLGGVVYSQSASLGVAKIGSYPFSTMNASYEKLSTSEIQGMDRKVSKKFEGSTLEEILSWLSSEKLNFIADLSAYRNARISLNLDGVKLGEALDSIATLFDAHWERKGEVFTLKPSYKTVAPEAPAFVGRAPMTWVGQSDKTPRIDVQTKKLNDESFEFVVPPSGIEDKSDVLDRFEIRSKDGLTKAFRYDAKTKKMVPFELKSLDKFAPMMRFSVPELPMGHLFEGPMYWNEGQAYKIDPKTGKQVPLSKEEKAKIEKEWKVWGEKYGKEWEKWGEEYGKQWESWAKDFEKSMKDGKGVYVLPKTPQGAPPNMALPKTPQFFYKFDGDSKPMTKEQQKAFEESMRAMEKSLEGMKLPEKMFDEKAMKELENHLQKMELDGAKVRVMDKEAMKELENHLKEMKLEGGKMRMIDPKALEELRSLKELKLDGGKLRMLDPKALEELRSLKGMKLDGKAMSELQRKEVEKALDKARIEMKAAPLGGLRVPATPRTPMVLTSEKIEKLLDSLTAEQKATHKDRGYLKWSELTPAQREILGVSTDGQFTISFTVGERNITIKND